MKLGEQCQPAAPPAATDTVASNNAPRGHVTPRSTQMRRCQGASWGQGIPSHNRVLQSVSASSRHRKKPRSVKEPNPSLGAVTAEFLPSATKKRARRL